MSLRDPSSGSLQVWIGTLLETVFFNICTEGLLVIDYMPWSMHPLQGAKSYSFTRPGYRWQHHRGLLVRTLDVHWQNARRGPLSGGSYTKRDWKDWDLSVSYAKDRRGCSRWTFLKWRRIHSRARLRSYCSCCRLHFNGVSVANSCQYAPALLRWQNTMVAPMCACNVFYNGVICFSHPFVFGVQKCQVWRASTCALSRFRDDLCVYSIVFHCCSCNREGGYHASISSRWIQQWLQLVSDTIGSPRRFQAW